MPLFFSFEIFDKPHFKAPQCHVIGNGRWLEVAQGLGQPTGHSV